MEKMKSDTPLDYAVFQLSPKHSRCELFVSRHGKKEKLASGLLKPFISHLKVAEEQVASAAQSVNLEVGKNEKADSWFTKGTLERFVRFVSTPEVLELVNTYEAEMSQLEAARRIYSQGSGDHHSSGGGGSGLTAADATKKELLRAIDVRLVAVQQDLSTACARAVAAGFDIDAVSELQIFADRFGAHRLNEACSKFISLSERRSDLINPWKTRTEDRAVRSSYGSDMSIEDDPPSPTVRQESTASMLSNPTCVTFPLHRSSSISRESSVERDDGNKLNDSVSEKDGKDGSSVTPESISLSQPARRLSVQDRINMFESKQKETSGSKPAVTKAGDLRRMSSDVSAAEKAVFRRWSGASDMSIDFSAEKKDVDSPLCTPSSVAGSQEKTFLNANDIIVKSSSSVKPEVKVIPSLARVSDGGSKDYSFNESQQLPEPSKLDERDGLKDQASMKTQSKSFIHRNEKQDKSDENMNTSVGGGNEGVFGLSDKGRPKRSPSYEELSRPPTKITAEKDLSSSFTQTRPSEGKSRQVESSNQREDSGSIDNCVTQARPRATGKSVAEFGVSEGVAGSRIREAFAARYKGTQSNPLSGQQEVKPVSKTDAIEKKEPHFSEDVSSSSVADGEFSGPSRMKFNRQGSATEPSRKVQVQRDDSSFTGNSRAPFSVKVKSEAQESFDSFSTPPPEQAQKARQTKGNQELNDELQFKANELEKLFAEHKLRIPVDQLNSVRKGKSGDTRGEPEITLQYSKPVVDASPTLFHNYQSAEHTGSSKNKTKLNASSLTKAVDAQGSGITLSKSFSDLSISEGSRGKFYDKYMQKRDAKLKEEWSSNRAEKEARLKSLHDSLNRSRSEMKAKFSGSAGQDSPSSVHRRAERLRSYNSRPIMKREQQRLEFEDSEDEDAMDYVEQSHLREDRTLDDPSFGDGISRGSQAKKLLSNGRSMLSSTPRTLAAPIPKSASKTSTTNSGKRRMQPENPIAQSVPNFSDLRKENTKPSSGGSKTARLHVRNYSRSRSISEEVDVVKEDNKSRRLQTVKKTSANPGELKEMSPVDSDGVTLTPIKFDDEILKSVATKPFLKKGSRTIFDARASIARQKASVEASASNNIEENDVFVSGPDDLVDTVEDEVEEQFETLNTEDGKNLEDEEPTLRPESDNFVDSGSDNGDSTPFSRVDQALGSQPHNELPLGFLPIESTQELPGESPISWNSRAQHSFSYPHEMSDIDNSVDSPVGSPSWNQMEIDAARMRKKWGTAQKPTLVGHSSNNVTRKDRSRGFKRFLKFGRKNNGSESLLDWLSATTSEGDDDTEDGRDLANRSSEDLRKSRMGFSLAQPSEDSFNESEYFNESVPPSESSIPAIPANFKLREDHMSGNSYKASRSFFSLSTFRSKGSDSKPR